MAENRGRPSEKPAVALDKVGIRKLKIKYGILIEVNQLMDVGK